jgi:hypothetical protein
MLKFIITIIGPWMGHGVFSAELTAFNFNSNKSSTRCNHFPVYYPDVYLQLNMFRAFSRPSSRAQ